jgi:hypothetical protein
MRTSICFVILALCSLTAFAQQPTFEAELAPPVYSTQPVFAFRWVAYGYLYPIGTFANLPPCSPPPSGAKIIGSYKIGGEYGDPSSHAATYVLRFGNPNDGKQFAFGGFIQYLLDELNLPTAETYSGVRVSRGFAELVDVEFTPASSGCFGGIVRVFNQ